MAVVDDYLAVRPEAAERLRRLVGSGRVAIGPWYALPDEFLVSGETLVRNLQLGLRAGGRYGGAMEVGYLPDMFGHVAQMPQLLAGFGFEHAVVWRGVPAAVDSQRLLVAGARRLARCGPSTCPTATATARRCPTTPRRSWPRSAGFAEEWARPARRARALDERHRPPVPQPWLGRVVAEADDLQDDFDLRVVSLAEHLAGGAHRRRCRAGAASCAPGRGPTC